MCAPPFGLEIEGLHAPAPGNVCLILPLLICNVTSNPRAAEEIGSNGTGEVVRKKQVSSENWMAEMEARSFRVAVLKVPAVLISAFDRWLPCAVLWVWPWAAISMIDSFPCCPRCMACARRCPSSACRESSCPCTVLAGLSCYISFYNWSFSFWLEHD